MTEVGHPVLCGGTFLTQILLSRKQTATRRQRTQGVTDIFREPDVLCELVKIVQPDYIRPAGATFKTYTTNYKKCANYTPDDLKFENESVMLAFLVRLETEYASELNKATAFTNQFIDISATTQNHVLLVKRLIELIRDDTSIPDTIQFAVRKDGSLVSKSELVDVTEVYLPAFLLSVWKFIVTERKDNSIGAETISAWQHSTNPNHNAGIDGSTILQDLKVTCDEVVTQSNPAIAPQNSEEPIAKLVEDGIIPEISMREEIREYLDKTYKWHEKIKTLLYYRTPRLFYDFYVCNDLMCNDRIIENVTVAQLQTSSHFVILSGTGGIGKTMMLRHLLLNAIEGYESLGLLPILIPLKEFGETTSDLFEYVHSVVNRFNVGLSQVQLKSALTAGSCLLLFDGMDEIRSSDLTRFSSGLESLACGYSNNYFVLSSRPSWLLSRMSNFCEMELQPFSKKQAVKMIDNFTFSDGEEKVKVLFRARLEDDLWFSHREFAEIPLLLTIMLMTFDEYAEVPSKMYKFYEAVFETLAKKHDDTKLLAREFKSGLSKDEIAELLAKICFLSTREEKYEFTEDEFKNYFERCRRNSPEAVRADDYLHDLCGNICILQFDSGKYRFIHRSFQEYFCALNIKRTFDKVSFDKNTQLSSVLIAFFDDRKHVNDKILEMLYDMAPEKVNEFIFLPKLEELLCSDSRSIEAGYWAFLEKAFQTLRCWHEYHKCIEIDEETGEMLDESSYDFALDSDGLVSSEILSFIIYNTLESFDDEDDVFDGTYYDNETIMSKVPKIIDEFKQAEISDAHNRIKIEDPSSNREIIEYSCFTKVDEDYWFSVAAVRENQDQYSELLSVLWDDDFKYKRLYLGLIEFLAELKSKQKATDAEWLDEFIK